MTTKDKIMWNDRCYLDGLSTHTLTLLLNAVNMKIGWMKTSVHTPIMKSLNDDTDQDEQLLYEYCEARGVMQAELSRRIEHERREKEWQEARLNKGPKKDDGPVFPDFLWSRRHEK